MSDRFRVRFEPPVCGGLPITLTTTEHMLFFVASDTPYDSLFDLISVLITVVLTDTVQCAVRWSTEPVEYEFHFATNTNTTSLTISEWPDSTRQHADRHVVFQVHGSRREIVVPFWRALQHLTSRGSETWEWQHALPKDTIQHLDQLLRRIQQP